MTKDQFFDTVRRWVKKDVERMLTSIPAEDGQDGNINFPLALCVLAYTENLGSYLIGRYQKHGLPIKVYIEQCFDDPQKYDAALLHAFFRNGLAHQYFPGGGISRDEHQHPMYRTPYGGEEIVVLDAETLANDFLKSLDTFFVKLTDANFSSRRAEIEAAHKKLLNQHQQAIAQLPYRAPVQSVSMGVSADVYRAPISGASTLKGPVKVTPWDNLKKGPTSSNTTSTSSSAASERHTTTLEPK